MNAVKVVGGLVEIGAAFKFLNTADCAFVVPDEAWFNVNMMQKDMLLALELGRQVDVHDPDLSADGIHLTARGNQALAESLVDPMYQAVRSR